MKVDVHEVSLVAILDADKEGFLRNERGSSRPLDVLPVIASHVIMYGHRCQSMQRAIDETARRRKIQMAYNEEHGVVPQTIQKKSVTWFNMTKAVSKEEDKKSISIALNKQERKELVKKLEKQIQKPLRCLTLNSQLRSAIWCRKWRPWIGEFYKSLVINGHPDKSYCQAIFKWL